MKALQVLPTSVHGIIDYLMGITLLAAPSMFGFSSLGGPAVLIPRTLGVIIILMSLITNYEWSVAKIIPLKTHLTIDLLAGALLIISPFIFGFSNYASNVWGPHIFAGLLEIIVALMTQTRPSQRHAIA